MFTFRAWPTCLMAGALALAALVMPASRARAAEPDPAPGFEVHDVSVWMLDRGGNTANSKSIYSSALPVTISTLRGAQDPSAVQINGAVPVFNGNAFVANAPVAPAPAKAPQRMAPINLLTFHGPVCDNLDVDIRTRSGSFLGHWPPAEALPNRLRWAGTPAYSLVAKVDDAELMFVDSDHWMAKARDSDGLYVKRGARSERFLAYDVELNLSAPVRLEGGPDTFTVINTSGAPLSDVLIARVTPEGIRVGWLDELPKGDAPVEAANAVPNAETPAVAAPAPVAVDGLLVERRRVFAPQPAPRVAAAQAAVAAARQAAAAAKPAAAPAQPPELPAPAPGSKLFGGLPAAKPGSKLFGGLPTAKPAQGVTVTLSAPLAADSAAAQTEQALAARLTKAGLSARESALFVERYGAQLFKSPELVVACRLDPATLDEKLPLSVFPEPLKTVRVGMVIVRNLDPQMGDEAEKLIVQLGDAKWTVREAAQKRLLELGAVAFPALKKGLDSADPEVVLRAERILLKQNQQPDARAGAAAGGAIGIAPAAAGALQFQLVPAAPAVLRRVAR